MEADAAGSGSTYTTIGASAGGGVGPQKDMETTSPTVGSAYQTGGAAGGADGQPSFDL
jgi:hypothetical protein